MFVKKQYMLNKIKKYLSVALISVLAVTSIWFVYWAYDTFKIPGMVMSSTNWNDYVFSSRAWIRKVLTATGSDMIMWTTGNLWIWVNEPFSKVHVKQNIDDIHWWFTIEKSDSAASWRMFVDTGSNVVLQKWANSNQFALKSEWWIRIWTATGSATATVSWWLSIDLDPDTNDKIWDRKYYDERLINAWSWEILAWEFGEGAINQTHFSSWAITLDHVDTSLVQKRIIGSCGSWTNLQSVTASWTINCAPLVIPELENDPVNPENWEIWMLTTP